MKTVQSDYVFSIPVLYNERYKTVNYWKSQFAKKSEEISKLKNDEKGLAILKGLCYYNRAQEIRV